MGFYTGYIGLPIMLAGGWWPGILISTLLLIPPAADWLIQESGIRESNNLRRLITGITGGIGISGCSIGLGILVSGLF